MTTELATKENGQLATVQPSVMEIVAQAVRDGRPASELTELLAFAREVRKDDAERAFNAAFVQFKKDCGPIVRRTKDEYITVNRNGTRQPRMYASLDDIAGTVDEPLHRNGFTYDFGDAILTNDQCVIRTFILRHEAGHSRNTNSPPIPIEGGDAYKKIDSARKATSASPQQRMGVADTYAKRYAMTSGLGIATCDEDDDGHSGHHPVANITEDQANDLNDRLIEVKADIPAFKRYMGVDKLADIKASDLPRALAAIESKRKGAKA